MLEKRIINHYILDISKVRDYTPKCNFNCVIYNNFFDIPSTALEKIRAYFGEEKITVFKLRFAVGHKLVATMRDSELVSFCFFHDKPFKFNFFKLNNYEIYFYDCYTFEEFRGLGCIYREVRFVIEKYKDLHYKYAVVEIEDSNIASKRAFEKLGFKKIKTFYHFSLFGVGITLVSSKATSLKEKNE